MLKMAAEDVIVRADAPKIPAGWDPRFSKQGGHGARSYSYHPLDEVLSSLQKASRRGWAEEAAYWALEGFYSGVAGTRTNTWNRLLVIASEDVGVADPGLLPLLIYHSLHSRDNKYAIAACVYLLARARKTRVSDWAACFYSNFSEVAAATAEAGFRKALAAFARSSGTPEELERRLVAALLKRDMMESMKLVKLLRAHPGQRTGGRLRKAEYGVVKAFREVVGKSRLLDAWEELVMRPNWRWADKTMVMYMHTVILWCNDAWDDAEAACPTAEACASLIDMPAVREMADVHERERPPHGVPDIALDMHTSRGRSMKRGFEHFVAEGALLNNEAPEWSELSAWFYEGAFGQ